MKMPNITTDFHLRRTAVLAVIGVVLVFGVAAAFMWLQRPVEQLSCVTEESEFKVQGESLAGVAATNSSARARWGFYGCNTPKMGDVVAVKFGEGTNLKVVRGLPGTQIGWEQEGDSWRLLLNGQALRSSTDELYSFTGGDKELLTMSLGSDALIPQGAYLLLPSFADMRRDKGFGGVVRSEEILANIQLNQ